VGLRDLREQAGGKKEAKAKAALPVFKQYREKDGRFHFKLVDAFGRELLVSPGFASPREAGQAVAALKAGAGTRAFRGDALWLDEAEVARLAEGIVAGDVIAALEAFATEEDA
jgi:tryptophanyl-tRNA synthetase